MDWALVISGLLNIILAIVSAYLAKRGVDLGKKIGLIATFIADFAAAYADKTITREEAQKLIEDVKRIIQDP